MPYQYFDRLKPDPATQTVSAALSSDRANHNAMLHAVITAQMPRWMFDPTYNAQGFVTTVMWLNADERIREIHTYHTAGAAIGCVKFSEYDYSDNAGSAWQRLGTRTYGYNTEGYVNNSSWIDS